nr:AfsR/SARP family transcriptional regulator [Amycolatopsis anabasis]
MQLGVLGPLLVAKDGVSYVPSAPKARQLLALLLINANEFVSVDYCIEELWSTDPPKSVMSTLQTYVLQIRRLLRSIPDGAGGDLLLTRKQGYQLLVPRESFDRAIFDRLVLDAHTALACNEDYRAAELFRSALALWRGPVLVDVLPGPAISAYQLEMKECRLGVLEQRIEADLRLGRHGGLLGELRKLADAYPMHENIHAQLMVALYRSGRQAEAARVFHRLSRVLGDQLGLLPCPRMQRLYEAIIAADKVLEVPTRQVESERGALV